MHFGLQSMYYKYTWATNLWDQGRRDAKVKQLDLTCCRRDSASLQAVVWAQEDILLTVSGDPLFWKGGPLSIARIELQTDPQLQADMKLIGLIDDDDGTFKSDVLLDQQHIFVEKRKIQQVWVELHAGADTLPGVYTGKLRLFTHTLFEDEALREEVTFTLTVKEELLPEPKDYKFYLDLWQHNCNIARKYETGLWTEEHFAIIDEYLESLAQLGQKALTVVVSEIPWSGQRNHLVRDPSDMFEYSMVKVTRSKDGSFHYDFSAMDLYIEMGRRRGIHAEIELFGLLNIWLDEEAGYGSIVNGYPDAIRVRYFDEHAGVYRFIREYNELTAYIQALEAHFIEKGWIELVRVLADEPADIELFKRRLEVLRQAAPSFRYKTAINHADFIQQNLDGMHDFVPLLSCAASEFGRLAELKRDIPGKLLYYVCCNPDKPNTFIGSPAIESRLIPWLAEKLQLDGFLRWNYTVWPDRPLEKLSFRTPIWKSGDTNFVYPGENGKPMLSLRYKWLQRGIRDYEYMQLLKESGHGEQVRKALETVFYFTDPKELNAETKKAEHLYSLNAEDYDRLYQ